MAASIGRGKLFQKINSLNYCECRVLAFRLKSTSFKGDVKPESESPKPKGVENDWIGPADKVSNIRKFRYYIPDNESEEEKAYRLTRGETQEWHHQFWTEHNKRFFMLKDEFIKRKMKEKDINVGEGKDADNSVTPEELSEFYRQFLDENYTLHKNYNKEWYKKNISLLWPALKIKFKKKFV